MFMLSILGTSHVTSSNIVLMISSPFWLFIFLVRCKHLDNFIKRVFWRPNPHLQLALVQKMDFISLMLKFAPSPGNGKPICQPSDFQCGQLGLGKRGDCSYSMPFFIQFSIKLFSHFFSP